MSTKKQGVNRYRVKIDFPGSIHSIGDVIEVNDSHMAYVIDGNEEDNGKYNLVDYPDIYELISEPKDSVVITDSNECPCCHGSKIESIWHNQYRCTECGNIWGLG